MKNVLLQHVSRVFLLMFSGARTHAELPSFSGFSCSVVLTLTLLRRTQALRTVAS